MKYRASILAAIAAVLIIPMNLRAALPALTNLTLAWDPAGGAATYTLCWGAASGNYTFSNSCVASQTSLTASNLLANQFHYFAVIAVDASGNQSSYSAEVVYAPAPDSLTVSGPPGGGSPANAVWSSTASAAAYTLYWGTQNGIYLFNQTCAAPQTNLSIGSMVANQTYYFAVVASDAGGNKSGYSPQVVYTNTYLQPTPPAGLAVSGPPAGGPTATASWGSVANVASYQLRWGTTSHNYAFNNSCPSSQTSLDAAALQTNTVYYFAVACTGANGLQSPLSSEVVYSNAIASSPSTNGPAVTLAAPPGLVAAPGTNNGIPGVALAWSSVANAAGYGLYWGTNSQGYIWNDNIAGLQTVVTNLVGGGIYYFAVMALGGTGTNSSGFSSEVVYTNALGSPGNFTASAAPNGVQTSWSPVTNASGYVVSCGPQSGVYVASATCPSSETSLTVTNLAANNVYYLAVAALATNGNPGPYSAEIVFTNSVAVATNNPVQTNNPAPTNNLVTTILAPLGAGVSPGAAANSAVVTWGATNVAASYQLFWGTGTIGNPNLTTSVLTTETNVTVNNLSPGQTYVFIVYALDATFQQITWGNMVGYTNVYVAPPITPAFPPSTNQIPGIPPVLGMSFNNGRPNLLVAGTVGARILIQATANLGNPLAWSTVDTVTLTNPATGSAPSANNLPAILQAAFAPALQVYAPQIPQTGCAPAQSYRVSIPYDYATLAYQTLPAKNYPTRLIGIYMPGLSGNVCYVTNQYNYLYCDNNTFNISVQSSGPTIRQIASSLAGILNQNWTSAVELSYSNGVYQAIASVIETDPPSSDQVAGQQPPSPIQINF